VKGEGSGTERGLSFPATALSARRIVFNLGLSCGARLECRTPSLCERDTEQFA